MSPTRARVRAPIALKLALLGATMLATPVFASHPRIAEHARRRQHREFILAHPGAQHSRCEGRGQALLDLVALAVPGRHSFHSFHDFAGIAFVLQAIEDVEEVNRFLRCQPERFLEQQHAVPSARLKKLLATEGRGALNYLYTGASSDALVQALDPEWPGPLPHTILVAPGAGPGSDACCC